MLMGIHCFRLAGAKLVSCFAILSFSFLIICGEFIEEPGPGPVLAAIGMQAELNCSVTEGNRVAWALDLPNENEEVFTDQSGILEALVNRGITVKEPAERSSVLVVNGTVENNGTVVTCIAANESDPTARPRSRNVLVIIENIPVMTTPDNTALTMENPTFDNSGSGTPVAAIIVPIIIIVLIISVATIILVVLFLNHAKKQDGHSSNDIKLQEAATFDFDSSTLPLIKQENVKTKKLLCPASEGHSEIHLADVIGLSEKDLKISESDEPYKKTVVIKKFNNLAALIPEYKEYSWIAEELRHPNIALPLGFCHIAKEPFLMMEYMEHKDLNSFMKNTKNVSRETKLKICQQIADAMECINSNDIIHCNLTSENCLVGDSEDGGFVVKVTDFKLCNDLRNRHFRFTVDMYDTLLIRWMAPECFTKRKFTRWTDRWAFGVVMWEIFTDCRNLPYQDLKTKQEIIDYIRVNTLLCPDNCDDKVFHIMKSCWHKEPKKRPIFRDLSDQLSIS